jgi:hypothetical protein
LAAFLRLSFSEAFVRLVNLTERSFPVKLANTLVKILGKQIFCEFFQNLARVLAGELTGEGEMKAISVSF